MLRIHPLFGRGYIGKWIDHSFLREAYDYIVSLAAGADPLSQRKESHYLEALSNKVLTRVIENHFSDLIIL